MFQIESYLFGRCAVGKNYRSITVLIILCAALIISSCSEVVSEDRSFLTGKPCSAPCWYGLEPGISKFTDVGLVLKKLPFVDQTTIHETSSSLFVEKYDYDKEITYKCMYTTKRSQCGNLYFDKEVLKSISTYVAYPLTFRDAVKQLGDPDYIFYSIFGPEDISCTLSIKWKNKSVSAISYRTRQPCPTQDEIKIGRKVNPNIQIIQLNYFFKDDTDQKLCDNCIAWPGFSDD